MNRIWPILSSETGRWVSATVVAMVALPFLVEPSMVTGSADSFGAWLEALVAWFVPLQAVLQTAYVGLTVALLWSGWQRLRPWAEAWHRRGG